MNVPDWVQDSVFYQIFPDRFANGDPSNDPPNVQSWGDRPTIWGFQGGDLKGIIQKLDYLSDLGVNAIYLNPIFQATSNHRYNPTDYFQIDSRLGSMDDFLILLHRVHDRGMRIILDGVFNHCGRGFFAFLDVMENQEHSSYQDWFHIKRFPLEPYKPGNARNYLGWWKLKSLPKFNTDNPKVRQYIFDVARYWVDLGIDGWRLDVPNEIDDDGFWGEFRQVVKSSNPEAYLLGEIWTVDPRWVGPQHFDGLMHYPLRSLILELIKDEKIEVPEFIDKAGHMHSVYPGENSSAQWLTLGTHDTPRIATVVKGDHRKVKLAFLILFSLPGAPAIFYGDEIGLEGGKDPDCRRAFPWEEDQWDRELRDFVKKLIRLRGEHAVLRRGELQFIEGPGQDIVVVSRTLDGSAMLLAFNPRDRLITCQLPVEWTDGAEIEDLLLGDSYSVSAGTITLRLNPFQGALLVPRR